MTDWITIEAPPYLKQREAMQGEFFSTESIANEAQALVREGIQNSLDAAVEDPVTRKKRPRVRIYVSGKNGALPWRKVSPFFESAWPHFQAEDSGLLTSETPSYGSECPFLVFEDFGTSGLTGDVAQSNRPSKGEENAFYYYLRAEGQSGKSDSDRGRWGIGKFVFPKASRVRSFLALSKRADDQQTVVTGQFILKWHSVDGKQYSPDGWFGLKNQDGILLPSTDELLAETFKDTFRLGRNEESGLSLVVPWCRPDIDRHVLITSVLRDFYYPILKGELEVEIADPDHSEVISQNSFGDVFERSKKHLTSDEIGTIELAIEATEGHGITAFKANVNEKKEPEWSDDLLDEETAASLGRLINEGSLVSIRVPIWVHKNEGDPERSQVRIWLRRDESATNGKPVFIREGLVIPAAHSTLARGFRSLVLIEDKPIARLLGDAENPSHTKWDAKSEHFQGKYPSGKGARTITFVRTIVSKLVAAITKSSGEKDLLTFANDFKAPPIDDGNQGKKQVKGKRKKIIEPKPPGERKIKLWEDSKLKDGFAVYSSGQDFSGEKLLTIRVGYDVVRGNPLTRWAPFDFQLDKGKGINIECTGNGIVNNSVTRKGNRFIVKLSNKDFRVQFGGFDARRDLYMDARIKDAD